MNIPVKIFLKLYHEENLVFLKNRGFCFFPIILKSTGHLYASPPNTSISNILISVLYRPFIIKNLSIFTVLKCDNKYKKKGINEKLYIYHSTQ